MLPNLEILWVNCNNIENLPLFLETVAESFPNLKHISMMKNKAAPSFFNGGSVQEHKDYRSEFDRIHCVGVLCIYKNVL